MDAHGWHLHCGADGDLVVSLVALLEAWTVGVIVGVDTGHSRIVGDAGVDEDVNGHVASTAGRVQVLGGWRFSIMSSASTSST